MLCPQAVRTAYDRRDNDDPVDNGCCCHDGMIEPEELADTVVEELRNESFMILPHPGCSRLHAQ